MKKIIYAVAAMLALAGCAGGGDASSVNQEQTEDSAAADPAEEMLEEEEEVSIVLPSAVEIMTVFKSAGLSYESGLGLESNKASSYNTKHERSIVLGVYTADLAYNVLNGQSQQAIDYLNAVKSMSESLGLSSIYENEALLKRFESNVSNEDSTIAVLSEIQMITDDFIEENELERVALVIFTGAWLEGMYLGVEANDDYNVSAVAERVDEQMRILNNLIKGLESQDYEQGQTLELIASLKAINSAYRSKVEANGGETLSLKELKSLADQIVELRNTQV